MLKWNTIFFFKIKQTNETSRTHDEDPPYCRSIGERRCFIEEGRLCTVSRWNNFCGKPTSPKQDNIRISQIVVCSLCVYYVWVYVTQVRVRRLRYRSSRIFCCCRRCWLLLIRYVLLESRYIRNTCIVWVAPLNARQTIIFQ